LQNGQAYKADHHESRAGWPVKIGTAIDRLVTGAITPNSTPIIDASVATFRIGRTSFFLTIKC